MITISWQTIITLASFVTAVVTLFKLYNKGYDMIKHQAEQDKKIQELRKDLNDTVKDIKSEQALLTYGLLACLKGLAEQGCDGPVKEAITKIEKHLNEAAHT